MNTLNLANLSELVYKKLEEIQFFYPHKSPELAIIENNQKEKNEAIPHLKKFVVTNTPTENIWIFDNELNGNAKKTFVSAGDKVEKTVLWLHNEQLHILMFEMKRTMDCSNIKKVLSKTESTLSHLSVFLASHPYISALKTPLNPITICAYNQINEDRYMLGIDIHETYRTNIVRAGKNCIFEFAEPIIFGKTRIPFLFYQNPNAPLTDNFEINFEDIFAQIETYLNT